MKYIVSVIFVSVFVWGCRFSDEDSRPVNPQAEYTLESPGEWAGLEKKHLPEFSIESPIPGKKILRVRTEDEKYFHQNHYVERVGVYNKDKVDIVSQTLNRPVNGQYQSVNVKLDLSFSPETQNRPMVYIRCNLHDLWVVPLVFEK